MPGVSQTTRELYPLSSKKILKKSLSPLWGLCVLYALLFLFPAILNSTFSSAYSELVSGDNVIFTPEVIIFLTVLIGAIVILNILYQYWYFKTYYYNLEDDLLVIRKNPITPSEISVPYERLQDVYLDQDVMDRLLGIYDLHVSSATLMSGGLAHIDGLTKESAYKLKSLILSKMKDKSIGKSSGSGL